MSRILTMFLLVAAITAWSVETLNRERLIKRLDQARLVVRSLPRVQAENTELVRRQPFIGELESLRRDRVEVVALRRELIHLEQSTEASKAALSALGQEILPFMLWLPTAAMTSIGRATPHAALQTFFAAANAGDIPGLRAVLTMEGAGSLDAADEDTHAAEWLVRRAPFGDVQIMAERLKGFDQAVEFIVLRARDGEVTPVPVRLRWQQDGWRVMVPAEVLASGAATAAMAPALPHNAPTLPEP